MSESVPKPVILCILDGWGHSEDAEQNAIAQAHTPHWDALLARYPHSLINASEAFVGLPDGQMGNSEVGHLNIGAGRIVMQDLPRIDRAIADGSFADNAHLHRFIATLQQSGGDCHLMGLLSDGGVHAHQRHMLALANAVAHAGVTVYLHAFLDGRDTPPRSAKTYLAELLEQIQPHPGIHLASLCGRYYAMDRDKRWQRIANAYEMLTEAQGIVTNSPLDAIQQQYELNVTDEFIPPHSIGNYAGMKNGDGLLMANFRADRARQILQALILPSFDGFARKQVIDFAALAGMVDYSSELATYMPALFAPQSVKNGLGETVANAGLKQLRLAETEKYAHVTFFMNGGVEEPFEGEERLLIPSPDVATYDMKPEMSAVELTDALIRAIEANQYDLIIVNYANTDMVGHTGNLPAAIRAVETVDQCLGRVHEALQQAGGALLITADHGNAECMQDTHTHQPHTAHTRNLVPVVLVHPALPAETNLPEGGALKDVAPTLLRWMNLPQPDEMTGKPLEQNAELCYETA